MNPSDLIIRSCDGVDLHTHKTIRVSFSSPVFRDMLAFPEPAGADVNLQRDAKPVTPLPESGRAVEKLFLLCYPSLVGNHLFTDLDGVDEAYPAADKYQLNGGQKRLEEIMPDAHSLTREPHRVYAIACHRGLAELAKTAAKTMLKQSFLLHTFLLIPEYKFVSVHQFVRFQHFRERCIGAMEEVLLEETSTVSAYEAVYLGGVWWRTDGHSLQCGPDMDSDDYVEPAKWFTEHVESGREFAGGHGTMSNVYHWRTNVPPPDGDYTR
ncbi:hypothetical protein DFH09DRAFT_1435020 [Mycena vulgaris]|nr:hypothetical protein DFH09DRAFT_1435020 [Mycena vulgaris]